METAFNQPHVQITNCKEVKFINEKRLNNKLLSFQFIHTVLRTCDKTATTNTYISLFPRFAGPNKPQLHNGQNVCTSCCKYILYNCKFKWKCMKWMNIFALNYKQNWEQLQQILSSVSSFFLLTTIKGHVFHWSKKKTKREQIFENPTKTGHMKGSY